ncbi:MAG TPA: Cof-type HAD-IIB family hydrolase [Acidimicrobiales bacterium]|nr:Cof-type HAD-IIB family hydrolase [Acidimicrobiales bacterium]
MSGNAIRLVLADVDGTLVTPDKQLTPATVDAVDALHEAGILFAITSGRPPRGMAMLVTPLRLSTPISAFNGGVVVEPDMTVIEERVLGPELVGPTIDLLGSSGLSTWVYRRQDWYVLDANGPHVDREAATVGFEPTVVESLERLSDGVAKIVGVTDDRHVIDAATSEMRERFGDRVSAAQSQPYYLDVTHPEANKGSVVKSLAARFALATEEIATLGDMPNDVLMFAHSGLSIAMGNASAAVQRSARRVTASNTDDGFAQAVRRFVLG